MDIFFNNTVSPETHMILNLLLGLGVTLASLFQIVKILFNRNIDRKNKNRVIFNCFIATLIGSFLVAREVFNWGSLF